MIDLIQQDYNGDKAAYTSEVLSAQDPEKRLFTDIEKIINSAEYDEIIEGAADFLARPLLSPNEYDTAIKMVFMAALYTQNTILLTKVLNTRTDVTTLKITVKNVKLEESAFIKIHALIDKKLQALNLDPLTHEAKCIISKRRADILEEAGIFEGGVEYDTDLQQEPYNAAPTVRNLTKPANNISELLLSLDKGNSKVWNLKATDSNQLFYDFRINTLAAKDKKGTEEANILCSVNFESLEKEGLSLSKNLTAFDRHVYRAIDALITAGHDYFTISQVYSVMGYSKSPSKNQVEKVLNSILKMIKTMITIDNQAESNKYNNYAHFKYQGALLPVELVTGEYQSIKGKTRTVETTTLIHPLRTLPLLDFARGRGQVTTIKREVFVKIESKTESTLALNDYLYARVAHMKSGKANSNKILLNSIYAEVGITDRKQKSRSKDKIEDILEVYKRLKYIKSYTFQVDGYIIAW